MGITFTNFADDTAMTRAAMETELDRARNWLDGGIVIADIQDEAVQAIHLYKAESYGFPVHGTHGEWGDLYHQMHALREMAGPPREDGGGVAAVGAQRPYLWENRTERESIFIGEGAGAASVPIPGTIIPVPLRTTSDVEVVINFSATNIYDNARGGPPLYNGTSTFSGQFELVSRDRATGVVTEYDQSTRGLRSRWLDAVDERIGVSVFETAALMQPAAGLHDVYLTFRLAAGNPAHYQVVVSVRNIMVEVNEV